MKETKFKQTEVGMIPSDWEVKTLGELYKVHNGLSKGKQFFGHGYPFLSFSVVFNNVFIPNKLENLVDSSKEERASYSINKGDVFITRTSETVDELGMSCVALKDYPNATYNGFCKRLRPNDVEFVNLGYLGFYLRSDFIREWFLKFSTVTTRASLKNDELLSLPLVLPPTIEEQQRIANALSDVDTLIANLEKLIAKKKNIKQGAMQQLLTGRKRLPGFGSDERQKECHSERSAKREVEESSGYKMTELGMIPTDWESINLGSIADIRTGKRNGDESETFGKYPFFVRSQTVYRINSYSFDGEAILIPGEGGIGSIFHYINGKFDYHQRVYKISDFSVNFSAKYLFYFMKRYFGPYAMTLTVKATVDSLRLPTFENFVVWYPPSKAEQTAIANVLSDIDTEIATLETKLAKYRTLKTGMMQQLLTGKIRLV